MAISGGNSGGNLGYDASYGLALAPRSLVEGTVTVVPAMSVGWGRSVAKVGCPPAHSDGRPLALVLVLPLAPSVDDSVARRRSVCSKPAGGHPWNCQAPAISMHWPPSPSPLLASPLCCWCSARPSAAR